MGQEETRREGLATDQGISLVGKAESGHVISVKGNVLLHLLQCNNCNICNKKLPDWETLWDYIGGPCPDGSTVVVNLVINPTPTFRFMII